MNDTQKINWKIELHACARTIRCLWQVYVSLERAMKEDVSRGTLDSLSDSLRIIGNMISEKESHLKYLENPPFNIGFLYDKTEKEARNEQR